MCGLAGFLGGRGDFDSDFYMINRMTNTLNHRGPDDAGVWVDSSRRISLGHRRLAIVDLSAAGRQPMVSNCGRYVIAFNGEIYNHLLLRESLKDVFWRGNSDTETLLACIVAWGLEATLTKLIGMFAIALWDRESETLTLVRDRMGEKPLYFGWQGIGNDLVFVFGSEPKALRAHPSCSAEIDRSALCLLLRYGYIPAPYSIYKGISKLGAGALLTVSLRHSEHKISKYWDTGKVASASIATPFSGSPGAAVDELETLAKDAVSQQMIADVPLGAFLSGGVDSTTVVALMQAQSNKPVKTFTIGFDDDAYSEARYAKKIAKHLGTDHNELYVTAQQALEVIHQLPRVYCEPFADSSQIPTFLVSQFAKKQVTVSLSGDAGDELFCGYNRYHLTAHLWKKLAVIPTPIRCIGARAITSVSPQTWNRYASFLPLTSIGDKLHKGANVMASSTVADLYVGMVSSWTNPSAVVVGGSEPTTLINEFASQLLGFSDIERMMAMDTMTYLPDDILVKLDRAAMMNSLECRVPFLDHRILEYAWRLPMEYKLREGQTKWVLRQLLYRYVPSELIERPKMGFGFPIDKWLRGPLKLWAERLIDEARLRREGFFHPEPIRKRWEEHLSGSRNWSSQLWAVLMFQEWLEQENW